MATNDPVGYIGQGFCCVSHVLCLCCNEHADNSPPPNAGLFKRNLYYCIFKVSSFCVKLNWDIKIFLQFQGVWLLSV